MLVEEQRQRRQRSDVGAVRQTARDAQVLEFMTHQYGLPLDLVAQATGVSTPRSYALGSRWKKAGWVETGKVDPGATWVWPKRGMASQYLGWDAPYWRPLATTTAHTRAVAAVRLHQAGLDASRWISERSLRHEQGYRKKGQTEPHTPDGIEIRPDGTRILVEVELTAKSPGRYLEQQAQSFNTYNGLLLQISNRADELGCQAVAYWCAPAALSVVQNAVNEFQGRLRQRPGHDPNAEQRWFVNRLEDVPGWTVQH